ncbi:MAG: hypothetical protein KDC79_14605 [Cyclobacteriaceae bacterium]|nr:hypothetical protein [Cyclobacteriaceae bacterium]
MKVTGVFVSIGLAALLSLSSCNQSKSDWSQEDKDKWLKTCNDTFANNAVRQDDKEQLEDLCKCMLDETSRKYTVEEAANLTIDDQRKLLENCNYSW